jgi:hypothetical protein
MRILCAIDDVCDGRGDNGAVEGGNVLINSAGRASVV